MHIVKRWLNSNAGEAVPLTVDDKMGPTQEINTDLAPVLRDLGTKGCTVSVQVDGGDGMLSALLTVTIWDLDPE